LGLLLWGLTDVNESYKSTYRRDGDPAPVHIRWNLKAAQYTLMNSSDQSYPFLDTYFQTLTLQVANADTDAQRLAVPL
jgi:hypothetical protein